ncbi:type I methionyl aminopeptidase [Candidatus Woesebacteria bacterium]|nr:type I methionyl aminopeptidase [Candidatus Woesebacteria bacterium]
MVKINIKTPAEIEIMKEGGKKLALIKNSLKKSVREGVSAEKIEELASSLIEESGGKASFKMVKDYRWSACVNTNEGVVHGIPHPRIIFKKGDVVSVDVGLFYKGFHTDTSFTVALSPNRQTKKFMNAGKEALANAVSAAKVGGRVYDISKSIEETLDKYGYNPIEALVGHGVGKNLHEDPQIPCFTKGSRDESPIIPLGATLAIEVMYTQGSPEVYIDASDGWTILTKDGKIAALFEETVAVTADGPIVLTA